MSRPELSIVIPFYNEEACCEQVLHRLILELDQNGIDYQLLPVNNGSSDRTGEILDRCARDCPRLKVVTIHQNRGYGWGVISGLRQGEGEYLGYVDGDTQIPSSEVVRVFRHMVERNADIGKATRQQRLDGIKRKAISSVYNTFFKLLFACSVRDINAKPKILRRDCFHALDLQSMDWFIDAEIILKAQTRAMRVEEIEISFLPRREGVSKFRWSTVWEFVINILRYRLFARLYRSGDPHDPPASV
jgi:glycosyltransferase involved in cell wall biosynthesis